jgi:hypothetical protein
MRIPACTLLLTLPTRLAVCSSWPLHLPLHVASSIVRQLCSRMPAIEKLLWQVSVDATTTAANCLYIPAGTADNYKRMVCLLIPSSSDSYPLSGCIHSQLQALYPLSLCLTAHFLQQSWVPSCMPWQLLPPSSLLQLHSPLPSRLPLNQRHPSLQHLSHRPEPETLH